MNRLIARPWFVPTLATVCYLAGFNDEFLHLIGSWWLDLGRWVQTVVVVVVLGLVTYLVVDRLRERRSYYLAAVRAAAAEAGVVAPAAAAPGTGRPDTVAVGDHAMSADREGQW